MLWREYCKYWRNMLHRIKLRLISEHKRKALWAFMRMKEGTDRAIHLELLELNENQCNENQDLVNEIGQKRERIT
jgi:hypothetical protein